MFGKKQNPAEQVRPEQVKRLREAKAEWADATDDEDVGVPGGKARMKRAQATQDAVRRNSTVAEIRAEERGGW